MKFGRIASYCQRGEFIDAASQVRDLCSKASENMYQAQFSACHLKKLVFAMSLCPELQKTVNRLVRDTKKSICEELVQDVTQFQSMLLDD